mgnify:CR=1 FL=1
MATNEPLQLNLGSLRSAMSLTLHTHHASRIWHGRAAAEGRPGIVGLNGYIAVMNKMKRGAEHLQGATVVKVFNAILAADLLTDTRPHGSSERRALPVAADDADAKALVVGLLDELGFDAVDAGSLDDSWRFERAKPAYCAPLDKSALEKALAASER